MGGRLAEFDFLVLEGVHEQVVWPMVVRELKVPTEGGYAVKKAAEFAELSDYSVEVYPKELSPFQEFMKQLSGVSILAFRSIVPETLLKLIKKDEKRPLHEMIYTRLPFDIEIR